MTPPDWTTRLHTQAPRLPAEHRHAAVALVLRTAGTPCELLLMRRAERPGDRWSGQISLPGGHRDPEDADLAATAIRETREEIGLRLEEPAVGWLPPVQALARGRRLDLTIAPAVFVCPPNPQLELGPEAEEAFWFPLDRAIRGELDAPFHYEHEGRTIELPSWVHEGRTVWGLTHKIVRAFLARTGIG